MNNNILKGVAISFILTFCLLLIYAMLLTYTNIQENTINTVITIIIIISAIIGSFFTTRKIKKNGIINGAITGILYIMLVYIISGLCGGGFMVSYYRIALMAGVTVSGIIGGIVGVNI